MIIILVTDNLVINYIPFPTKQLLLENIHSSLLTLYISYTVVKVLSLTNPTLFQSFTTGPFLSESELF